jgi:hypothetical protein
MLAWNKRERMMLLVERMGTGETPVHGGVGHRLLLHVWIGALPPHRCQGVPCCSTLWGVKPIWSHLPAVTSTGPHDFDGCPPLPTRCP